MILHWYIHWFWITSLLAQSPNVMEVMSNTTTTLSPTLNRTTDDFIYTTVPPTNVTKSTSNATTVAGQTLNDQSVIEPNVTVSDTLNSTTENITISAENITIGSVSYGNETRLDADMVGSSESDNLSAAGITGITLGCVFLVCVVTATSFFLYKNRGFNRPQVLNDHCSTLDSSGYIDDTSIRDNSEEMYSLDNDSFLNSLEAMTIQNYWTDNVKHTKL